MPLTEDIIKPPSRLLDDAEYHMSVLVDLTMANGSQYKNLEGPRVRGGGPR